ncbi:hypothetical protein PRNP1_004390 [Phytophthora ramorum]
MNQDEEGRRVYFVATVKVEGGIKPAARGGATLTQMDSGAVYLVGGANREGTSFGDVYQFDLEAHLWTFVQPSSGSLPPRSGHSAVAIGTHIYVFGGLDAAAGEIYNCVHIFNTRTSSWSEAIVEGDTPLARNAHAAVVLPENDKSTESRRMLVYGGSSPEFGAFSDLFLLHIPVDSAGGETKTLRWEKLSPSGEIPESRELHCALVQSDNTICFAGGRNFDGKVCTDMALLNVSTWTWQLVPICEWNRCSLAAGVVGGDLISFGGWDGGRICGDCCRYSDDEESWLPVPIVKYTDEKEPADPSLSEIPERFGHCGSTVTMQLSSSGGGKTEREGLLIFGGMNAECDLDDLVLITSTAS